MFVVQADDIFAFFRDKMASVSVPPTFDERFFLQSEDDLPFEEDILRNSYSVRHWLRYIDHKKESNAANRVDAVNMLYERAVKELPGSYKIWIRYLRFRVKQTQEKKINDSSFREANNCFERALVFMHKMPRVWIEYLNILIRQSLITHTRRTFDRGLQALPITQHSRIWPLYLEFIKSYDIPESAIRVYSRFLKLQPESAESYVSYLLSINRLDEAAVKLAEIVNDDRFVSREGKSKFVLWNELCELVSRHPDEVKSLNVEAIIREGIKRYTDQQGKLWNSLAEYFTRAGRLEDAKDVYEEAMTEVMTIRDFSQVFDAYAQSEERIVNIMMEQELSDEDEVELELRLARYEDLIERRPLLLNSVSLRQNPHNVDEWLKRVHLLEGKPLEIINTYLKAVQTIDAKQAIGKLHSLWVQFARFYEDHDQIPDARLVFEKAVQSDFAKVDDLANIWCEYAEMEIRNHSPKNAIRLLERATAAPAKGKISFYDTSEPVQNRVYKSLKIWSLYADLEESFGTYKSTKAVYDRVIDLKIATPQIIINYGMFLEENNYFEEAFKAYEKGIDLFKFPLVFDIWNVYLKKFLARFKGTKLERARDLFEQVLAYCPREYAKGFYLMYAKLEEEHGLAKHAMSIYDRAVTGVPKKDQMEIYNIYLKKASHLLGITHTRAIYEKAIEVLSDDEAREMCLRYADLERKLGEIDRARAIYAHGSQMSDPRTCASFWDTWRDFEIKHGNEDTIREMLRIKRSVQATFNTQVNFMAANFVAATDTMKALEAEAVKGQENDQQEELIQPTIVSQSATRQDRILFIKSTTQEKTEEEKIANPDEIDLDEDDEEEEAPSRNIRLEQKTVPAEVFGGLMPSAKQLEENE